MDLFKEILLGIGLICVIALILYLYPPLPKGIVGEIYVKRILKRFIRKNKSGFQFRDFLINADNGTSQIDNILFTKKGIYVIEVKNYHGHIYGSQNNLNWTMTTKKTYRYKSGYTKTYYDKFKFYNPIKQNTTHINKLKSVYDSRDLPVFNIVVFGNGAYLKDVSHENGIYVINMSQLSKLIIYLEENMPDKLHENKLIEESEILFGLNIEGYKARREHVKRINEKYK